NKSEDNKNSQYGVLQVMRINNDFSKFDKAVLTEIRDIVKDAVKNYYTQIAADTDFLTNAANRKVFMERLDIEKNRGEKYGTKYSMMIFDLDHFKKFNDDYGHDQGDYVLTEVVKIVTDELDKTYTFARIGGEEFALLMPDTGREKAYEIAETLKNRISAHEFKSLKDNSNIQVTTSVGVASWDETDGKEHNIMKVADENLYLAKQERSCVR
ncbi:MAG: GGDEF domain-containing protein, partial [Nanoarchaeota archaeon]|nr:GGDEF domain-containing protein [Nanoarchaeota archaeon]